MSQHNVSGLVGWPSQLNKCTGSCKGSCKREVAVPQLPIDEEAASCGARLVGVHGHLESTWKANPHPWRLEAGTSDCGTIGKLPRTVYHAAAACVLQQDGVSPGKFHR